MVLNFHRVSSQCLFLSINNSLN